MENRDSGKNSSKDLDNEEFWNDLSEMFALTMQMLHELADKQGINLENLKDDIKVRPVDDKEIETHAVIRLARIYFESSHEWLSANRKTINDKMEEHRKLVIKEINPGENADNLLALNDLYDIINWYHTMILVKLKRAVLGLLEDDFEDEIQNDMNGTAKVVLNCIDRSIFAWSGLLNHMPEQEEISLRNLVTLQKLKRNIYTWFPNADKFIRPGFDEQ
ncbi:MAG: hypothetical protein WD022_06210 [Balneolaceae bacterium]